MKKNFSTSDIPKKFSIIEILLYPLIVTGLKKAEAAKLTSNEDVAKYLLGYISARISIQALEDQFIELVEKNSLYTKKTQDK
jgi:hypothetical protein